MMRRCTFIIAGYALFAWSAAAQYPKIVSMGPEERMPGGGPGRLSSIATDMSHQPHIVCDGGSYAYFYDKIGNSWRASSFDSGVVGSRQYYNPHIEIDSRNRAWVSGVLFGGVVGLGIIVRTDMATAPSSVYFSIVRLQGEWDDGNLSLDPSKPDAMVVSGARGIWKGYVYDASASGRIRNTSQGQMYAGQGGEKNAFWISKTGSLWHGAIGGWDSWSSSYQNSVRHAARLPTVTWADFAAYPSQGDDGVYVGLCSDNKNPQVAYMTSAFGGTRGVCVNIWNGAKMLFSPSALLCIDASGGSGLRRYAPQVAPAKDGGAFICWTRGDRIKIRYIAPDGGTGPEVDVGAGTMGNLCVDSEGNLHVVYNNGGIRYRKINIAGRVGYVTKPSDYDSDGKKDLTVFDPGTGKWYIYSIGQQKVLAKDVQWGWAGTLPVTGDYDGDGVDDISTYDPATGNWFFWSTAKGHHLGMNVHFGGPGMIPVPGDYDGDGCSDIAVYQELTGNWYIWDVIEAKRMVWGLNWGFPGAKPMPGDYNGDGKTELCVYDSATGNWFIRTTTAIYKWSFNWGWAGAIPSSGDFDGDGADDLAIFDPVAGNWFFWTVHKGAPLGQFVQFGGTGFQPVPADYDNDQVCDIAVFDPVGCNWYIWDTLDAKVMLWKKNWGFAGTIPLGASK